MQNEIEIKKSKFIAYGFEVETVEQIEKLKKDLEKEHKKATHICYAYTLSSPFQEKCNDDGEPHGTAGRPILNVLQKQNRQNFIVFVVRYFGGIKLGAGGLTRAYTKATSELLKGV